MDWIRKCIRYTNGYFKEHMLKHLLWVSIVFVVSGLITFLGVRLLPAEVLEAVYAAISGIFESKDLVDADGTLSFWGILINNLRAGALIGVLGLVPFFFLPLLCIVLNSAVIGGFMAVLDVMTDANVAMLFIKFILPHGIFELPALVLTGAIGVKLCTFLCCKKNRKGKARHNRFGLR